MAAVASGAELHEAVFFNRIKEVKRILQTFPPCHRRDDRHSHPINTQDGHGNTPLHLAVILGYDKVALLLLEAGASCTLPNANKWHAMVEAIASSNRLLVSHMAAAMRETARNVYGEKHARVHEHLLGLRDFDCRLHWEFSSWVPFVSRFCPSDTYLIRKRGCNIRVDLSLVGMEGHSWIRKDTSILYIGDPQAAWGDDATAPDHPHPPTHAGLPLEAPSADADADADLDDITLLSPDPPTSGKRRRKRKKRKRKPELFTRGLYILSREEQTIQKVQSDDMMMSEREMQMEVEAILRESIKVADCPLDEITFAPQTGWFSGARQEDVSGFIANVYDVRGVAISTHERTEHLSPELRARIAERDRIIRELHDDHERIAALPDTERERAEAEWEAAWEATRAASREPIELEPYTPVAVSSPLDRLRYLERGTEAIRSRPLIVKSQRRAFKGTVWMAPDFPMTVAQWLPLLDILAPAGPEFDELHHLLSSQLPDDGFPVQVEVPLYKVIKGRATFLDFVPLERDADLVEEIREGPDGALSSVVDRPAGEDALFALPTGWRVVAPRAAHRRRTSQ